MGRRKRTNSEGDGPFLPFDEPPDPPPRGAPDDSPVTPTAGARQSPARSPPDHTTRLPECAGAVVEDEERYEYSGYRGMWMFAMFDLPVTTKEARKRYTRFRTALLRRGFTMLQFSVYARHCASESSADGIRVDVQGVLPPDGQVRLLLVTDRQFGKMEVYVGKKRKRTEEPPTQFMLF